MFFELVNAITKKDADLGNMLTLIFVDEL